VVREIPKMKGEQVKKKSEQRMPRRNGRVDNKRTLNREEHDYKKDLIGSSHDWLPTRESSNLVDTQRERKKSCCKGVKLQKKKITHKKRQIWIPQKMRQTGGHGKQWLRGSGKGRTTMGRGKKIRILSLRKSVRAVKEMQKS